MLKTITTVIRIPKKRPRKFDPFPKNPEKSTRPRNEINMSKAESPAILFTVDCAQILMGSISSGC
ncbi:MAG: hypothetical protein ACFFA7_12775 [Promethearchaeota archaeon]